MPEASHKTVQIKQFVAQSPLEGPLLNRVATVAYMEPDVVWDVYDATAVELWELTQSLGVVLADDLF